MKSTWKGVYPALTTQFREDESIDFAATAKHLEALMQAGIHGVVLLGTVGENTALEPQEKLEVLRQMKQVVRGRIPVLTGVAEYTTALMVLPAMVYKSDDRETMAHYRAVAASTGLPIMAYNNPVSYSVDITPEMFQQLEDVTNLVAIKESSENVRRITDLRNIVGDRYTLFGGVDDLVLESVMLGAEGWISGLVNAFPEENRALWDLAAAGQWEAARDLYRWYTPLLHLDTKVKLVQYIKLAMAETGLGSEKTRAPRLKIEGAERDEVLGIIRRAIATRPQLHASR
jgi:1-pyrroline-4-hydroxy-2-carboxylate deaminase